MQMYSTVIVRTVTWPVSVCFLDYAQAQPMEGPLRLFFVPLRMKSKTKRAYGVPEKA